ncbi:leucine-rich repeat domain-containing protein [Microcoleus sp. Pol11C2]|uniref:leucine-rich repeat domain-containing protein n=1 Tax=Microcoleus sp. Pol11C2 TaxID=3055389 RepID=UPI002FD151DA
MPEPQANQPINFSSFADWCLHFDSLSQAARHTVEVLLKCAGTSDIDEANGILSSRNKLTISRNQISDITPLQSLTHLTHLYLYNHQISDITPLQSLTHLKTLDLHDNQISDITPLQSLTNLTSLNLSNNQISDISFLQSLTNLTELDLRGNQISDYTPLLSLTNLTELDLHNHQISDITPLQFLTHLKTLDLRDNQISDITPLQSLTHLKKLDLHNNQISDIRPLQSLAHLKTLDLRDNQISDHTPLLSLTNVTELKLSITPEHKTLIEAGRHKWETLAKPTQLIESKKAAAAVKAAYNALGFGVPEILFCNSPTEALSQFKLKTYEDEIWRDGLEQQVINALHPLILSIKLRRQFSEGPIVWEEQVCRKMKRDLSYWNRSSATVTRTYLVDALALIDFYIFSLGIVFRPEFLKVVESMKQLLAECGWIFMFHNVCYVCSRPTQLYLDSEYRLHAEGESAIAFADGYSLYFHHGVILPKKYGKVHPDLWQAEWLLSESNAELRRVLIERIGYDRICQQLQAVELDSWQEYTLLKIDNADVEPIYLLKMTCPSTGHIHALRVPPDVTSAKEAIRWVNWDIDPEEFSVQT